MKPGNKTASAEEASFASAGPKGSVESLFAAGGETGALMAATDWSRTALGPVEKWPQNLRTCVRIILTSRQPMFVWWGEELINLYNDAYLSIIGGKHPEALGHPASVVWREIWDQVAPRVESAMRSNEGTYDEALLLIMERYGYQEETYYTFSYSPVPADSGGPGGILCANSDDTRRIVSERQLAVLRDLAARTGDARTWLDACRLSAQSLAGDPKDICFALIYVLDSSKNTFVLAANTGIEAGLPVSPEAIDLHGPAVWPLAAALGEHRLIEVPDIDNLIPELPESAWGRPPHTAAVVPIAPSGPSGRAGAMVMGLNPYRRLDEGYRGFLELVAGQVAASMGNAQAYEEERQRAEALAEIDRAKTLFFSNVSHEFRTPLTLMLGPVEDMLQDHAAPLPEAHSNRLELVHRNSLRLLKLVNTLLDFSRLEAGRVQAHYEPTDISSVTSELASMFESATARAGLKLQVQCDPIYEPVYVDREMWEKIVLNLLSNALKSTFEGCISVRTSRQADEAVLTISDTGTGIPEHELPHLFERFRRIEGARRRTHEGSGIGLALVNELVRMHGGSIEVSSKIDAGTTFRVRIPLGASHLPSEQVLGSSIRRQVSAGANFYVQEALSWLPGQNASGGLRPDFTLGPENTFAEAASTTERISGGKVLLVDDNRDMRDYVRELLSPHFKVETAANGRMALERARQNPPDLVLSDVMMPEMDGFELLAALRRSPATAAIPLILVSARAGEESSVEGMGAGADDYLVKPFTARELIARVSAHIQIARFRRETYEAQARLQHEMEQARRQALEALENISDGFWLIDSDWRYQFVNEAAVRLSKLSRSDIVGKTVWQLAPELKGSDLERSLQRAMYDRVPVEIEYVHAAWGVVFFNRVYPAPDGGIAIYTRDVTESKKAEDALRKAEKLAVAGRMAATIAHEINNPLEAITNLVYIARSDSRIPPQARGFLEAAERELERLSRIANKTLRFYRQSSQATRVQLAEIMDSVLLLFDTQLKHKSVEVIREFDESASLVCLVGEVQQVFTNLISNALDAMERGGTLRLRIRNSYDWSGEGDMGIRVSVGDTGTGIPRELKKRLFEPFMTTKGEFGTGLGLWVSREIVERHGARIQVRSRVGCGTVFSIFFPIRAADERSHAADIPA